MSGNENGTLVKSVGKILLNHMERNRKYGDLSITYGNVALQVSSNFSPRNLDSPLGELSELCKDLDLPLISTIVVNQTTMLPGDGYFKYFFSGLGKSKWKKIFDEQHELVLACEDWSPLAEELG